MQMTLVIYDIASDKRRRKVVKILESYGNRVQESAFELEIRPTEMRTLKKKLNFVIEDDEDNIRIYQLHKDTSIHKMGVHYDFDKSEKTIII